MYLSNYKIGKEETKMPSNKGKHTDNREKTKPHKVANNKKRETMQKKKSGANTQTKKP